MRAFIAGLLLSLCSLAAAAPKLACYQDRWSYSTMCIDESAVTSNGDTRAAPLYSGETSGSQETPYVLVTNCAERVSTLRTHEGGAVNVDMSSRATAVRVLAQWMCEVKNAAADPELRELKRANQARQ
jgi:hypothetical protein